MATKEAIKEHIYLHKVMQEINKQLGLSVVEDKIATLLLDNQSAIKLAENPEFHKRSKHIDIQYHFIRECVENNTVNIGYIPTLEQLADGFTKGLDTIKHKRFIQNLNMIKID